MISIVNYGIGNVGSVLNMLRHVGIPAQLVATPAEVEKAMVLLLPGVGAFGVAMQTLHERNLVTPLQRKVIEDRTPILGICLGMQLLARTSEEAPGSLGLGFIDADFIKFGDFQNNEGFKVPHMGWNTVEVKRPNPLIAEEGDEQRFYFVHSYYARCNDPADIVATTSYGNDFVCAYGHDNVWGTQFHPEKSHKFGMQLLKRFADFAC